MSYTAVILPILSVISIAEKEFLGVGGKWSPCNANQAILLDQYYPKKNQLSLISPNEMKSIASQDLSVVNRFLKENGFAIQLDERKDADFAVASILKIMLEWKKEAKKCSFTRDGKEYTAVSMNEGFRVRSNVLGVKQVEIEAKNGDIIYMSIAQQPLQGFELLERLEHYLTGNPNNPSRCFLSTWTEEYDSLIFPVVDIKQEVDIKWLERMSYGRAFITQALQETHFKMNDKGATAKSAVAIAGIRCCAPSKKSYSIDQPFYLWIMRPGMSIPLFAAYIEPSDWKEPADLN